MAGKGPLRVRMGGPRPVVAAWKGRAPARPHGRNRAIGACGATTKRCRLAWRRSAARKCTAARRPEGRKWHFVPWFGSRLWAATFATRLRALSAFGTGKPQRHEPALRADTKFFITRLPCRRYSRIERSLLFDCLGV